MVRMWVDRVEERVEWEKKSPDGKVWEQVVWAKLPKLLSNETTLYPTIGMFSPGDIVRIVK
jgi:hypothetical protein